jgi:carbon storage regulator CsrA
MLVLSRKQNQRLVIGGKIVIHILGITPTKVRLGIEAPPSVPVARQELLGDPPWCRPEEHSQRLCQGVYLEEVISEEQMTICKLCSCCHMELFVKPGSS